MGHLFPAGETPGTQSHFNQPAHGAHRPLLTAPVSAGMTSVDTAGTSRPKATLFCQTCGHESSVWDDWDVRSTAGRTTTNCPECGTTVDERPSHDSLPGQRVVARVKRTLASVGGALALSGLFLDPRP